MKQRVYLSAYTITVSAICLLILLVCLITCRDTWGIYAFGATIIVGILLALFYMPLSVSVDASNLNINRSLRIKSIPLADILTAYPCPPTMSERRIIGSGGFFGYWGRFYEPSIGRYFAYYGKASDCILIELKDGKKYLIGCSDPEAMAEYLNDRIDNRQKSSLIKTEH